MFKKYITTTIPYVNANPHVGFALELVQADTLARYQQLLGNSVRLQSGTDDNAFKNVLSAQTKGVSTRQFVDGNADAFKELSKTLNINLDSFIRTTDDRHKQGVYEFWKRLTPDDLYTHSYEGLYCTGCEDFYLERDLVNGCCPDHNQPAIRVEEENIFFRLSKYQDTILELLETDQICVYPQERKNEILSFVRSGLHDFSITRNAARSGNWGIPVPGHPDQVIYVWIEALVNYLSGLGFGSDDYLSTYWDDTAQKIHVIGKNVWKFHAVYWPALLLSAGLPLPDIILVHGFLTQDGQKISKSLGNAVDPQELINRYGTDALRYYLLKTIPPFQDGDFSEKRLKLCYNSDLANGLGNLVSRLTTLWRKSGCTVPIPSDTPQAPKGFQESFEQYKYNEALDILWQEIANLNRQIEKNRPWELLKDDHDTLREHLIRWIRSLHSISYWLSPFLPETSEKIQVILQRNPPPSQVHLFPRI